MKKDVLVLFITIMGITNIKAQENLTYQLPPESILQLADYQRAPAVSIDSHKNICCLVTATPTNRSTT